MGAIVVLSAIVTLTGMVPGAQPAQTPTFRSGADLVQMDVSVLDKDRMPVISLDDRLLERLKARAAQSGTTVSRLIEQAIRLMMRTPPRAKRRENFELVTFGAGGRFSTRNIDKTSSLVEAEDLERFAKRR